MSFNEKWRLFDTLVKGICGLLFVNSVLLANSAYAQDQASTSRFEIEEVVVTARKVEEGLQDAALAVSAFSAQELENRGALDVTDVALAVPNVHFQTGGATSGMSAAPTVFIRGIGQSDFNINNDPAVGMYIDGIYLGRMIGSLTDLLDLERAEVLRGPQGTLFGRNSIGGAINLISKKPDMSDVHGTFSASVGERDYVFLKGSINVPFSDSAAGRFSGFYREREGYVDAVQYDDFKLGGEDVWGLRAALRFEPSDSFSMDIAVDWSERRDPPAAMVPVALGNVSLNPGSGQVTGDDRSTFPSAFRFNTGMRHYGAGTPPPPNAAWVSSNTTLCSDPVMVDTSVDCFGNAHLLGNDKVNSRWVDKNGNVIEPEQQLDQGGVSLVLNWDLGFGTLTSTTAHREFDAQFNNDNDFTPHIIFHNLNDGFEQEQLSQELQLTGTVGEKLIYVAGLYYFEEDGVQSISLVTPLLPPAGAPGATAHLPFFQTIHRNIDNSSKAIYGQVTYDMSEAVRLTVGARYTDNEKEIDLNLLRGDQAAPWFSVARADSSSIDETNVLVNLSWDMNDQVMLYGQYADGFRDGGWPVRFPGLPAGIPPLNTVAFEPESVDSLELGIKATWLDERLRFNAAIFDSSYDDMQIQFSDPGLNGAPNTSNLGESSIRGFEAELNILATDNLRLDFALGWLDAELDSVIGGSLATGADNTRGTLTTANELPYAPEIQFSAGLNHSFDLSSGAYISTRIDWVYSDDQFYTIENSPRNAQDSYSLINARVTYTDSSEDWEISLGARNLADEEYSTIGRTQSDSGSSFASVGRPREVYLQATYHLDN